MSIITRNETKTIIEQEEVVSSNIMLGHRVSKNPVTGAIEVTYPSYICYERIVYELDANGVKIDFKVKEAGQIEISPEEVLSLYSLAITPLNGTMQSLGGFLSNSTDDHIRKFLESQGSIPVQPTN